VVEPLRLQAWDCITLHGTLIRGTLNPGHILLERKCQASAKLIALAWLDF